MEFIEANGLDFSVGNVIKYVVRATNGSPTPAKDLAKAAHYLRVVAARFSPEEPE